MRSRWRGIFVAMSLVAFAITVAAIVRSYFVADRIVWWNLTEDPVTRAAEREAARRGITPRFVAHWSWQWVCVVRGRVVVTRGEKNDVRSHWKENEFDRQFVNRPRWEFDHPPAAVADDDSPRTGLLGRLGFAYEEGTSMGMLYTGYQRWAFPIWLIALLTAVAPLVWLTRVARQWHRRRRGRCLACGYDLRGNPDGRRCPECGMIPEEAMPDYIRPRAPAVPAGR